MNLTGMFYAEWASARDLFDISKGGNQNEWISEFLKILKKLSLNASVVNRNLFHVNLWSPCVIMNLFAVPKDGIDVMGLHISEKCRFHILYGLNTGTRSQNPIFLQRKSADEVWNVYKENLFTSYIAYQLCITHKIEKMFFKAISRLLHYIWDPNMV